MECRPEPQSSRFWLGGAK